MIDFYFWTSPNPYKVSIFLEESELPYNLIPINTHSGEQHQPNFLELNPNGKVPVILQVGVSLNEQSVFDAPARKALFGQELTSNGDYVLK